MIQKELFYLILIILTLFTLLTFIFIYLIIQKMIANRERRAINKYKEQVKKSMFQYLNENKDSRLLFPDTTLKYKALEELLSDYAKLLNGENALESISEYATKHFYHLYQRKLFHRRWSIRMNTLYMIEEFKITSLLPEINKLYNSTKNITAAEEIQILKLMALFDDQDLLDRLKEPRKELSEFTIRTILGRLSEVRFTSLVNTFHELPVQLQYPILDIIGLKNLTVHHYHLRTLLKSDNSELRIRSLKALAAIGYPIPTSEIVSHFESSQWQERMMAAKLAGVLKDHVCLDGLSFLLEDKHFLVRNQAAHSILQLPNGRDVLSDISTESKDSFARDMAVEWLERGDL